MTVSAPSRRANLDAQTSQGSEEMSRGLQDVGCDVHLRYRQFLTLDARGSPSAAENAGGSARGSPTSAVFQPVG
jgi:hypothetical protein